MTDKRTIEEITQDVRDVHTGKVEGPLTKFMKSPEGIQAQRESTYNNMYALVSKSVTKYLKRYPFITGFKTYENWGYNMLVMKIETDNPIYIGAESRVDKMWPEEQKISLLEYDYDNKLTKEETNIYAEIRFNMNRLLVKLVEEIEARERL